jgi:predicted GNAT family N-acyltransferase
VIERRFHREVYPLAAVEGAVKTYARFASIEVVEAEQHRVVRVTTKKPERERRVADELANYALGLVREQAGVR